MKKPLFSPKAVIFDMDGVIVDSMPYHFIAWHEALCPRGLRMNCLDVYLKEGEKWQYTLRAICKQSGVAPEKRLLAEIFRDRDRIFKKYFKRSIFRGADETLAALKKQGCPLALVTGTPTAEMRRILPVKLQNYFDCIIAGDNVVRGKPHPEPYLRAARKLGVDRADCLVIENAPLGIRSAKRAGMKCIALTTSLPASYLSEADAVADTLTEAKAMITIRHETHRKNNAKA